MNLKGLFLIIMLNNFYNNVVTGENILVVLPICFSSHLRAFKPLVDELVNNGNNVTVISNYPMANDLQAKYTHVTVKTNYCVIQDEGVHSAQNMLQINRFTKLLRFFKFSYYFAEEILSLPELQRVINSQDHYDLIMAELFYMDAFFAFGYKFQAPVVGLCSTNLMYFYSWILGNPYPSSYIPNQLLWYSQNMPLFSRISNTIFNLYSILYYELVNLPNTQMQVEKYFNFDKNDVPNIKDIMKNISLVLVNSHYSLGYIKPELPNFVDIAGLHYPSSKSLPQKMITFMEEADHGVIYVSMGSFIEPKDFVELGNTFTRELKKLPQRVIMKWDPKLLTEVPENILVEKWISQTQVLNHLNCRLFITHGGIHSAFESINASVPILGIPVFSDQYYNMAAAEHLGVGRMVPFTEVSVKFSTEINEILSNPKYKENAIKRSQLFRERLVSPMDEVMYWIKHIMRHKTAAHLKPAAVHLTWYEFYGLDVLVILLSAILLTLFTLRLLIARILRSLLSRMQKWKFQEYRRAERKDYKID